MKNNPRILYLINKQEGNFFKIGITRQSRLKARMKEIERDFGKLNHKNSFLFFSNVEREIKDLERILHLVFRPQRRDSHYKKGVGKTEWFHSDISTDCISLVKTLRKNPNFSNLTAIYNLKGEHEYILFIKRIFLISFFQNIFS